jgi:hypothetical protein
MNNNITNNYEKAGYCGLFCDACIAYIATNEGQSRLESLSKTMNRSVEEITCNGCRTDVCSFYCKSCEMKLCAVEKNINFCSECSDYPCTIIVEFQKKMPHRIELFESLEFAKNNPLEKWKEKMIIDYSCQKCGTINSAYATACRNCGNDPGNPYIERNREKIINHFKK